MDDRRLFDARQSDGGRGRLEKIDGSSVALFAEKQLINFGGGIICLHKRLCPATPNDAK